MISLIQTGSGMLSARVGRCQPKSNFLSVTSTVTGIAPGNGGYLLSMEDLVLVRQDDSHGHNVFGSYKVDAAGQAKTADPKGWAPSFYNTTSYHMPVMYPVAEGRIFLRLGDGIYCYDLRKKD